ncbi:unnamed protein product [Paramecium sonneborni]|uniref:Uncharacterized protein n=1 Tax=Paramecium sonneborni TaxID=65129 RepID=A0A8S1K795_9CILI|nr:unnamed protein product [Paramecium sonneborni]
MGCAIKKEKQFSTININEQNTIYFVIINGDQQFKKVKQQYKFTNSVPILGSIGQSSIITRRNKQFKSEKSKMVLEMNNIETSIYIQNKK